MLLALAGTASCIDDKGNYTYIPAEEMFPVNISVPEAEENDNFLRGVKGDAFHVEAQVSGLEGGSGAYSFLWYAFPNISGVTTDERVELGTEQNLDLPSLTLKSGDWILCFRVTDNELGVFKESQINLTVSSSSFNRGWYIMKAKDDVADVDFFPNAYPAEGSEPTRNMIALAGCTLHGNPVAVAWQEYNYCHPVVDEYGTTNIELLEAWHFVTDRDMLVLQGGGDMIPLKDYDEQFYTPPTSHNPQAFFFFDTFNHQFLIDGNELYGVLGTAYKYVGTMTPKSIGKYTLKPSDHSYYPAIIPYGWSGDVVLFDNNGKSFYRYMPNSTSSNVNALSEYELDGETIDPGNMNADIVKLSGSLNYDGQTYILMHELDTDRYRLGKMPYGTSNLFESYNEVPAGSMLLDSEFMATPGVGDFVYFTRGNEIYYYRDAPGLDEREFKLFDVAADERITYMVCNSGWNGGNYLIIMTTKDGAWNCYFYLIPNTNQPEVTLPAEKVMSGEGVASRLMYKVW